MNTKRALALPVIAVMAATLLAGCGQTKDSATSPASIAPSAMMSAEPTMTPDAMMSDEATPSASAMMSDGTNG